MNISKTVNGFNITILEDDSDSDTIWFEVDGEVIGASDDGYCDEGGYTKGADWEAQNWPLIAALTVFSIELLEVINEIR